MYTNRVASAPVAAAVLPLGPNGDSEESIQKLFVANTVEELVAYKQSLNAQAAAVDGDVRQAIGQRYRDLLATCEEVVGMEAVCNHVDSAKQKRQRQINHLRAGAGVTGSTSATGRFALALRNTQKAAPYQHASLAGGVVNANSNITIHGENVAKGQGLTRRIHTVPLPSIGYDVPQIEISLSLAFQALTSRLNNLNALLDRCGAPAHLLAFSNRLDSKMSALREVKGPVGRTPTSAMGSPVTSTRFHTIAAGANSSSPASATPLRFAENNLSSVMSQLSTELIPYATQAENDASMLFHRVASEHYELVCHANTLAGILRKMSGESAIPVTGRLASSAEESDPSSRERAFALRMGAALQSQVLSILTPKHASPGTPHGAQATGRLRDIDTRCQIEELAIKAIGEAYHHISRSEGFSLERSHTPTNAAIALATSASALPATAIGPATTNVLLLFFNDLHQALMVEELIADNYAPQGGTVASVGRSEECNAAHTPALRALLRLVDLHELAMLREVESVTIQTESLSNSTQPQRKQTAAVLSSAKLSIRGTNALVAYLSLVLTTIVTKKTPRDNFGSNLDIAVDFSFRSRKGERNCASVNLLELVARRKQNIDSGAASIQSVPNSRHQNSSGSKLQRATPSAQAIISDDNDRNAFLDSMLVHVCGSIDAAPLYSTTGIRSASMDCFVSQASVAARVDTLTAHLLTPSAASRQSHSPTRALMTSLTCADAKDGCDAFLEWFVSSPFSESMGPHRHTGALAGEGAESVKGSGLSGAWALSPSPQRVFADNADRATSVSMQRVGGQFTFQTWSSGLAEAFMNPRRTASDMEEASSSSDVSQIIMGRVTSLQSFLARVMFGSDDGAQPSTSSLLATLLNKFSDVEKGSKAGSSSEVFHQKRSSPHNPSDTISSARALHSLEALLLSAGASICTSRVECWDFVAWRTAVENKLSSYVVSAVTAVIRGIADTVNTDHDLENKLFISEEAFSIASNQSSHIRSANATRDPARREHHALHAHSKVGLLQASATPLHSASKYDVNAASALANRQLSSIETSILGKIARFSKLGSPSNSRKSQVDDENKEESAGKEVPTGSSSSFAHRVGVLADLLEALTSIVCRDRLSNRSESLAQLSQTVRVSISEDLLNVLENTVSRHEEHEKSNTVVTPSTIPPITPFVGALLACLRALEEKVSVAASAARLSTDTHRSVVVPAIGSNLTSPVSGASSGIFSNELLCPAASHNSYLGGSDTIPPLLDAVRFVTSIIRPRLESLYVRCFSTKWIPTLGEGLRARLRDGWHSDLLLKSSVPMRHDYERLGRLLKSATKSMMRVEKRLKKASGAHTKKAEPSDLTTTSAGAGSGLVEKNKYVMPFRTRKMLSLLQSYTNGPTLSGFFPSSVSEALAQSCAASHIPATSLPPVFTAPSSVLEFNKIAAERFRGSIQPLLWRTESIASSPEVSSFGSSVSYPSRPLPSVTDAIWWAQRTLEIDTALLFKAATHAQSQSRNSMRKSDPQELYIAATEQSALVTMTSSVLTPFVLSALQKAVRETIEEILSEASTSKKRSAATESALSTLASELVHIKEEASSKRHVAMSETAPKSVAAMATAPSATAEIVETKRDTDVGIKPDGGGAENGWGDDDEDFELGYSDDDDENKSEGIVGPATAASAENQIEAGIGGPTKVTRQQQAQNGESDSEISLASDTDDFDGADDIDESSIYDDFASATNFTRLSLSNANYRPPVVDASAAKKTFEYFGLCEEFYLQLAFDLKTLQQALAPISENEGTPCSWSEQCSKLLTDKIGAEVDFVNWSLTLPLISKHADAFFSDGRLLWRVLGLTPASFSGLSLSSPFAGAASPLTSDAASVASLTPIPSPFTASSTATPPAIVGSGLSGYSGGGGSLLLLPSQEVERLPLLPVALPQAALAPLPSAPLPSAPLGPQVLGGAGAASGQRAGFGRMETSTPAGVRDDAASRLVHGATASLKSFLGGW